MAVPRIMYRIEEDNLLRVNCIIWQSSYEPVRKIGGTKLNGESPGLTGRHLFELDTGDGPVRGALWRQFPTYGILPHTWGTDESELTYDDVRNGSGKDKAGYAKVKFCGQ
ncbi:hypothetical protein LTR17_021846 [Elasticomyces elasticus]|nr:hypothetical protein LTR17_021846 [Elasticomyces elasticus]